MAVQSTAFSALYGERLHRELGSEDTTSLFTVARRKAAVNEAALEWVKQTASFVKQVSVSLTDDTREYDLETVITADDFLWIDPQGVEYVHTNASSIVSYRAGQDFPQTTINVLNREASGWRGTTKTSFPATWYLRKDGGKTYFGMSEPPEVGSGETATITLPYVAKPLTMTADADVPYSVSSDALEVLEPWLQGIAHYAAALLEPLRKNYAGADRQRQLFAAFVADYLQKNRPKTGHAIIVDRPYYRHARGLLQRPRDPKVY